MSCRSRQIIALLAALLIAGCAWLPGTPAREPTPAAEAGVAASPSAAASATPSATATRTPTPTASPTPVLPSPTPVLLDPTPTLAPVSAELRDEIFQQVWTTVRDTYVYEDYRGVDWEQARVEFAPRVATADDPETFYALMRELIGLLDDEHSRFESPQEVAAQKAEYRGEYRYGGIGAQIRKVEEGGLITALAPDGPAARAGLLPRDIILAVNGIPFTDTAAFGPDGPIGAVRGAPGTRVRLTVRTGQQAPREVEVWREVINADAFNQVRVTMLPGRNIGYVEIPSFYVEGVDEKVRAGVEQLLAHGPLDGLILDVRANSGGYVHLMLQTVALFQDGGSIGSTRGRSVNEEQKVPTGKTIAGIERVPLVVLIGPDTASAAEMFAGGLQALGRARVVGTPSAGNTENLYSYDYADGSRLLLATVSYRLPDGTLIEGRGVLPDKVLDVEWWRFSIENDPQVNVAIDLIAASRARGGASPGPQRQSSSNPSGTSTSTAANAAVAR
jgi:C-terminal peptidase prc